MPTYDYRCAACGHALEIFHGMTEKPKRTCPACKKPKLERLISSGAGFLFKGEGFYLTDYRSQSYKAGEKAAQESAAPPAPKSDAPAAKPSPTKAPKTD
jgi:putative FmdB family regulatory protein